MRKHAEPPLPTRTYSQARHLRRNGTEAEQELWFHLRGGRWNGWKFRRQHPVPPFIVDFYCDAARLVVELDGSRHGGERDSMRTRYLESLGLEVLRYRDNDVLQRTDAVPAAILSAAEKRTLTPTPLPAGEWLNGEER